MDEFDSRGRLTAAGRAARLDKAAAAAFREVVKPEEEPKDEDKGWTVKTLREALSSLPDDTSVLFDGCDCCTSTEKCGVRLPDAKLDFAVVYRRSENADWRKDL